VTDSIAQVEVEGPSLTLRYATAADVTAMFELGSNAEVTRFFSWGPYSSMDQPARYIEGLEGERASGERLDFLIVRNGIGPIGVTGLIEPSRRDRRAVVGTWLARSEWGTGANAQAKALIAHLGFRVLGLERIGAYADVENGRSQAALERVGYTREGVLRRWHRHGDSVRDVVLFSLLKQEWLASADAELPVRVTGSPPSAFVTTAAAPS
jgi:[ribosomal protein S5]-alanine N-acetyltransferase